MTLRRRAGWLILSLNVGLAIATGYALPFLVAGAMGHWLTTNEPEA